MYTTCTLHVHYKYTTCTLQVHYMYTTSTLHAHYMYTTCTLQVRSATIRLIVRALSHVLASLDENFNLDLLRRFTSLGGHAEPSRSGPVSSEVEGVALWHGLGHCVPLFDWAVVARTAMLSGGTAARPAAVDPVANSGKHGPLEAAFPFSGRLVRLLDSKDVREASSKDVSGAVHDQEGDSLHMRMTALVSSVLGADMALLISSFARVRPEAYLHDMVASTASRFAGLTFGSQESDAPNPTPTFQLHL